MRLLILVTLIFGINELGFAKTGFEKPIRKMAKQIQERFVQPKEETVIVILPVYDYNERELLETFVVEQLHIELANLGIKIVNLALVELTAIRRKSTPYYQWESVTLSTAVRANFEVDIEVVDCGELFYINAHTPGYSYGQVTVQKTRTVKNFVNFLKMTKPDEKNTDIITKVYSPNR